LPFAKNTQRIWTVPLQNNEYLILHFGREMTNINCELQYLNCSFLYYTLLKRQGDGWVVLKKNIKLIDDFVNVKLALIQHANGRDWWVLTHKGGTNSNSTCNNLFYLLHIEDGMVNGLFTQNIGSTECLDEDIYGELIISNKGDLIANTNPQSGRIELYSFNRCNGELNDYKLVETKMPFNINGCFSPDGTKLYTTGTIAARESDGEMVVQYDLINSIVDTLFYASSDTAQFFLGDIKSSPHGKIYLSAAHILVPIQGDTVADMPVVYNKNLSIINKPNEPGVACQLEMFSVPLVEGCYSLSTLPSFPSYNLGALSIYEASAGADTLYINKEEQEGVQLGSPTVKGVVYQWQPAEGLNDANMAQPYATPNESRLYTVTLTDTTIQHSCKMRVDSVYVVVNNCKEGKYGKETTYEAVKIFPNPAHDKITISSSNNCLTIKEVAIIDTRGRTIINTTETTITVSELAESLYMVRIRFANGQTLTKKLVVYK
jgi:hypothetical protein